VKKKSAAPEAATPPAADTGAAPRRARKAEAAPAPAAKKTSAAARSATGAKAAAPKPTAKPAVAEAVAPIPAKSPARKTAKTPAGSTATGAAKASPARTSADAANDAATAVAAKPAARRKSQPAAVPQAVPEAQPAPAPAARRSRSAAGPVALPPAPQALAVAKPRLPGPLIHQIYFKADQRPGLDPAFVPLDNAGRDDPLREFAVFERLAAEAAQRQAPLWGALSWRFGQKTGLTGQALLQAIAAQPGQDLYYCNPFPEHEALYANGWQQGVSSHPAFTELCAAVFKAAGVDLAELSAVQHSQAFSACNYFVGSPAFWRAYLPWVRELLDRARAKLPPAVLRVLDSPLSDPRGLHAGSTYWPFIVERLLPLFLRQAGRGLKVHKLPLPAGEARLNTHLKRLREMKDVAHRSRSQWLYGCWLNYRNLYLLQTAGAEWCKRYLPKISATEVDFR
jgi:hypothetical protein